jgi:hypothetical protein
MTRLALTLAAACLAALLLPSAAAALIQVDRGIAGVRLDNTRAAVRAALGRPASRRSGDNEFGRFVEWRFPEGTSCHTGEFEAGGRVTDFWLDSGRVVRVTVGFVID